MEIELKGTVRGEEVTIGWCDGELRGNDVLLRRLDPLVGDGRCDLTDLASVIHGVELVAGQRMELRVVDQGAPAGSRVTNAA